VRNFSLSVLAFIFALGLTLQGCSNSFPPDKIDPAGNLTRKDYLALRHRGETKDEKNLSSEEDGPETADKAAPPPIPDMPMMLAPPPPEKTLPRKRVSVSMTENVPLRDVLMELGREGRVNLELDPRIQGGIIFTAHNQPFDDVIKRICALAGLRHRVDGEYIRIELDEPYQQTYPVDYLSLTRRTTSEVTIATNVFDVDVTSANGNGTTTGSRNNGSGNDNNSVAKIAGASDADFWSELEKSLTQVLATSSRSRPLLKDAAASPATGAPPANFSIDRQAGLVTVFGNALQQEAIGNYLRHLQRKATAQVLIEARIVEVELNEEFQSGINWRTLFGGAVNAAARFGTVGAGAPFTTATTAADGVFTASVKDKDFAGILNLVRTFGTTRVLSSPRLTVLNNQTAVLKVARNAVYFVTSAQYPTTVSTAGVPVSGTPVFSSTPRTVPVGLVMTVQPAIDADRGRVTMTLRPTISRVVDQVNDPSIGLNAANAGVSHPVQSQIPVLAVREMDSVLQTNSGEVAIMGGLMQDSSINTDVGVPPFDALPVVGNLAKSRDNTGTTSELVILLRATILNNPPPDNADAELYERYNRDPRPLPLPSTDS
jgi:MSHA type pilus biogenesis protein MshL